MDNICTLISNLMKCFYSDMFPCDFLTSVSSKCDGIFIIFLNMCENGSRTNIGNMRKGDKSSWGKE